MFEWGQKEHWGFSGAANPMAASVFLDEDPERLLWCTTSFWILRSTWFGDKGRGSASVVRGRDEKSKVVGNGVEMGFGLAENVGLVAVRKKKENYDGI